MADYFEEVELARYSFYVRNVLNFFLLQELDGYGFIRQFMYSHLNLAKSSSSNRFANIN